MAGIFTTNLAAGAAAWRLYVPEGCSEHSLVLVSDGSAALQIAGLPLAELRDLRDVIAAVVGTPMDEDLCEFLRRAAQAWDECTCGIGRKPCLHCLTATMLRRYDACRCEGESGERAPCPCLYCLAKRRERAEAASG